MFQESNEGVTNPGNQADNEGDNWVTRCRLDFSEGVSEWADGSA